MRNHDARSRSLRAPPGRGLGNEKASEEKDIFAFIIEIERAADLSMPRAVPIIALCDPRSQANWVSQNLVDYLAKYSHDLKSKGGFFRRMHSDGVHINIRWSCEKLGQYSEERTFFIEPKAQFKILFGHEYVEPEPVRIPKSFNPSSSTWSKRSSVESLASNRTVSSFQRGIEDGTLLKLRKMPYFTHDNTSHISVKDAEAELEYIYAIHAQTEVALSTDSKDLFQTPEILPTIIANSTSSADSFMTDREEYAGTMSTNTTLSDDRYNGNRHSYSRTLSDHLRHERNPYCVPKHSIQGPWGISSWFEQPISEEPQPLLSRIVDQSTESLDTHLGSLKLSDARSERLKEARALAEKEANNYWIWDKDVGNYKHFDEGCADPVWYMNRRVDCGDEYFG
ncbi:hypothetical protein BGZ60DRAFT_101530 [Tricladium varicosporioides]|nr:hypothetical protein BGZ60DRAFT_101530 [Hymenoscyphus varicosporioides]